jgi:hypothetical protein
MKMGALNICRAVVIAGFLLASILAFSVPVRMIEPDDWAYYFAARNFSRGELVVDNQVHAQQVNEAKQDGGNLAQYVRLADNKWALEKSPGYVFYLVPFALLHVPRLANVLLMLGATVVVYLLLKRLRDEKTAAAGSLLMLFTPVALIMLNRSYMDTFAAYSFLTIGGGLYIYYWLERDVASRRRSAALLFLAFLFTAWSGVVRYTNFAVAAVVLLHFIVMRLILLFRGDKRSLAYEVPAAVAGGCLPLLVLAWYNLSVFGSVFDNGYNYSSAPVKFSFQFLGRVDAQGRSIPLNIIAGHLHNMPLQLLLGFPLLAAAVPGFIYLVCRKFTAAKRDPPDASLRWNMLLLLTGWFLAVFLLYMLYEWTAAQKMDQRPFIIVARFYLPALLPLALAAALALGRLPVRLASGIVLAVALAGVFFYPQYGVAFKTNNPAAVATVAPQNPAQTTVSKIPEAVINQTRQEVKARPTDASSVRPRFQVLQQWISVLAARGYPVDKLYPPAKVNLIGSALSSGDLAQASQMVDRAYRDLEEMVLNASP